MVDNNLLSSKQFSFISGRSTVTQLVKYLDQCMDTMAKGGVVDTIYLNFAIAFDTIQHSRLLGKLRSFGIGETFLNGKELSLEIAPKLLRSLARNLFQHPC